VSKFESGKRVPTDKHLVALAKALSIDYSELRKHYLAEKVYQLLKDEEMGLESILLAEPRIEYLASNKVLDKIILTPEIIARIESKEIH